MRIAACRSAGGHSLQRSDSVSKLGNMAPSLACAMGGRKHCSWPEKLCMSTPMMCMMRAHKLEEDSQRKGCCRQAPSGVRRAAPGAANGAQKCLVHIDTCTLWDRSISTRDYARAHICQFCTLQHAGSMPGSQRQTTPGGAYCEQHLNFFLAPRQCITAILNISMDSSAA